MKASVKVREFNIFELFLHDSEAEPAAIDSQALREWMNKKAWELYPKYYIEFQCPDDTFASSHWYVRFHKDRYAVVMHPETYPALRLHDEREFRKAIPKELYEVLLALNDLEIVL